MKLHDEIKAGIDAALARLSNEIEEHAYRVTGPVTPLPEGYVPEPIQPSDRERELALSFFKNLKPGDNWTEALAKLLMDYREETRWAEMGDDV